MFDLISAVELTGVAALVIGTLAFAFGTRPRERLAIAAGLIAWFIAVLWMGATGLLDAKTGFGPPGLAVAVAVPVTLLVGLVVATAGGRARLATAPLTALIGVQTVRIAGVAFVMLYAAGRLPAPFAPVAGWGDILVGALAPFVAFAAARRAPAARSLAMGWTLLGMTDLVTAVGLGVLSSPGPTQVFTAGPSSAIMTNLPWILIPAFLVPLFFAVHFATWQKLRGATRATTLAMPRRGGVAA